MAAAQGQFERAARLLGAAEALREAIQARMPAVWRADYEHTYALLHSKLNSEHRKAAWRQGRTMDLEQALDAALASAEIQTSSASPLPT